MKLIEKNIFARQPDANTGVLAMAAYCSNDGRLMRYCTYTGSSDAFKDSTIAFSDDGGRSFHGERMDRTRWKIEKGMMTRYFKLTALDKRTDRFYMFYNQGLLPSDRPEDGLQNWQMYYCMSENNGDTITFEEPVVMKGDYSIDHPIEGVYIGKNNFMVGDWPCEPILTDDGRILMAVQCTMFDENGHIFNPGGGYTYQYSVLLHGRFLDDGHIEWFDISNRVEGNPATSTRGAIEPAVTDMPDGRILMVMRGSNGGTKDPECRIPGYRWYSVSNDGGFTFSKPVPWEYEDGVRFHSPSSCSKLLKHSNGKYYWIGNICEENSRANMPRNPLCICEIDTESLLLKKETKYDFIIREDHQYEDVTFSNFYAVEDKDTGDILVYCTALWQDRTNIYKNGDSYRYRLRP
ncbi:MAG TPA: sialidase family protein [Clostridia bacterium]|nr:sialidase family protein [Clostridia bacterium]HPQ47006.1 sialidase family protein [Clostridia bacterium]HRX41782.1 sialidase family protein [Clostridia bacterium]